MKIVFTDLDDTLFATKNRQEVTEGCIVASTDKDGKPSGYQNKKQQGLLEKLKLIGLVVPVTARTNLQYKRVLLDFGTNYILNSGASIILDDKIDQEWKGRTLNILKTTNQLIKSHWDLFVQENPNFIYDLIKPAGFNGLILQWGIKSNKQYDIDYIGRKLKSFILTHNLPLWMHYQNDKGVYLIPNGISKESAVEYVINKLKPEVSLGVGDNISDVPFMKLCDYCLFPSQCMALKNLNKN